MLRFLENLNLLNLLSIVKQNIQRLTSNLPKRLTSNLLKSVNLEQFWDVTEITSLMVSGRLTYQHNNMCVLLSFIHESLLLSEFRHLYKYKAKVHFLEIDSELTGKDAWKVELQIGNLIR